MFIPDEVYKLIIEYSIIPTVDIVFVNQNNEILLGYRNNEPLKGEYYIPGGRIQKGETIFEAVKRKAKEECGLLVNEENLIFIGVFDDIFDNSAFQGLSTHCIPCTFVYKLNDQEISRIKNDEQHAQMNFFSHTDTSFHPFLQKRLRQIQSVYNVF